MKDWLEYAAVWLLLKGLGFCPGPWHGGSPQEWPAFCTTLSPKLRKTAETNLRIAFPE